MFYSHVCLTFDQYMCADIQPLLINRDICPLAHEINKTLSPLGFQKFINTS